ncbi:MAG: hypothetical protein ACSHXY_12295 [Alphaproteobacteria bacterium]
MQNSFLWIIIAVALIALTYFVRALLGYRRVASDAAADYAYKYGEGMLEGWEDEADYVAAYKRFHAPRSAAYVASAMGGVLVLTYPAFSVINFLLEQFWILTGRSEVFHPGYLVWQFLIFFAILFLWAAIIYFTARRFHRRAPISFQQELLRQSGRLPN